MKVFVTGAAGYVGSHIVRALLERGHGVRAFVRPGRADDPNLPGTAVEIAEGDITQRDTLSGAVNGCDAVMHLVGLLEEIPEQGVTFERIHIDGARNVIDEATAAGVKRVVLMSANGVKPRSEAVSGYQWTKYEAEQYLKQTGLEYVIFRPSVLFGKPGVGQEEFASNLSDSLLSFPTFLPLPLFTTGFPLGRMARAACPHDPSWHTSLARDGSRIALQPVSVLNVAEGFA
ncbi:MAG: NAD(P)H-binding protein, partial [Candidatus Poribacteria bacterium]|nr:NAD(P)H-binding protein [Candidatus Poribacteria bacterium]